MSLASDLCSECGAPRDFDDVIKHLEAQVHNLTAQLKCEGENSEHYHKLFHDMKSDRDAWKKAYFDLKG
jgi:hypothetical protein